MSKYCLFNNKKICIDCGECNLCDMVEGKVCNNCGKCLQLEGIDTKATKLSDLLENQEDIEELLDDYNLKEIEDMPNFNCDIEEGEGYDVMDKEENWVYIDDLEDVREILNDPSLRNQAIDECYPGLLKFKSKK